MIYRFPHDAAFLPRTKLSYVNLPGLLSDGKRDRTARVPGYVAIQLGERCYLVFLREGEAFHAARLEPGGGRGPAALSQVLRLVNTESERGEGGQIGYYGAGDEQLRAMLATLVGTPVEWDGPVDLTRPDHLFPRVRERRFSGVLELRDGATFHYLDFHDGVYRGGWFCGRSEEVSLGEFVRTLFAGSGSALEATLYPALSELPTQAGPGLVDLYRRIVGGVMREVSGSAGRERAVELMRRGQAVTALQHPVVAAFDLTDEGRVAGDPVASPAELTDGVAMWVTEALIAASDAYGIDPGQTVEKTARDSRFVLAEHGFFARLPWAISL